MPYHVFCEKCQQHIAKGVRFNAEKKRAGKYFSTTIWNFSMNCTNCSNEIQIQTDPEHRDYAVVKGAIRRTSEDVQPDFASSGIITLKSENEQSEIREDPFKLLEHKKEDQEFGDVAKDQLIDLQEYRNRVSLDDYQLSRALRSKFREEKKEIKQRSDHAKKLNLSINLLPQSQEDTDLAKSLNIEKVQTTFEQQRKKDKLKVSSSSIFGGSSIKEQQRREIIQKCVSKGIDPKVFYGSHRQTSAATKLIGKSLVGPKQTTKFKPSTSKDNK
eukprot:TRINITY_DN3453_c0_g1_i3.p1 TRINITY_DN3453_c0_g1~~TRINITY_DN3453_c0_g1_i3.p1  ORF type:complete len:272 (+),score=64.04 TRINITY_DN3453_c0_g1_i3:228-1043(+)